MKTDEKVWSSPAWLAEVKTVLPLWKSLAVSHTVQLPYRMTCNPITSSLSKWNENLCGHKNLYMIICSVFFPKDPKLDNPTIQTHLARGIENKLRPNRTTEHHAALKRSKGRVQRTPRRTPSASCMLSFVGHPGKSKTIEAETDERFRGLEVWERLATKWHVGILGGRWWLWWWLYDPTYLSKVAELYTEKVNFTPCTFNIKFKKYIYIYTSL